MKKNQRFTAARPKICPRRPNQQSPPRFVLFFVEVSGEGSLIEVAISEDKSIGAKKSVTNLSSLLTNSKVQTATGKLLEGKRNGNESHIEQTNL